MKRITRIIRPIICMAVLLFAMTTAVMGCYQKETGSIDIPGRTPFGTSAPQPSATPAGEVIPSVDRQAELAEARAKNPNTVAWLYGDVNANRALREKRGELDKAKARLGELDHLFRKLYEDNALGRLSDQQFTFYEGNGRDYLMACNISTKSCGLIDRGSWCLYIRMDGTKSTICWIYS